MQKCYIAGKITGLPETEYIQNFKDAKRALHYMNLHPVCPIDLPHNHGKTWEDYMKECLIAMLQCPNVYALNNYKQSPGAKIEVELALELGINIIFQP